MTVEEHIVLEPPDGYTVDARYPATDVRYVYRFEPVVGGTSLLLTADVRPRHIGRLLVPLFRGRIQRYAERDTDFHLRTMAPDLRPPDA